MDKRDDDRVPLPPVPFSVFFKGRRARNYKPSHWTDRLASHAKKERDRLKQLGVRKRRKKA